MTEALRLAIVTTSRSDFGLVAPIAFKATTDQRFSCRIVVCGQHLAAHTPATSELAGLDVVRLPTPTGSISLVHQVALGEALREHRTEVALVMGDRFELLDVVMVATVAGCVIAHCSGGERTIGAIDNHVRDAVTKMAHLHCPSHLQAAERIAAMLEDDWRIRVTGEPGLDSLLVEPRLDNSFLQSLIGTVPEATDLVIAVHPVTQQPPETLEILGAVEATAREWSGRLFLSTPNGDPGSDVITATWNELARRHSRVTLIPSLGRHFRSLVARCGALIGNSSAGLVEAPSLGTPTVDVGTRQKGRLRGPSVITCPTPTPAEFLQAIEKALTLKGDKTPATWVNPYGDGKAVPRILDHVAAHGRRPGVRVK